MTDRAFRFEISDRQRPWSRLFLVHPELASARVQEGWLSCWFGPWSIATPIANIATVESTGPYDWWKVAGPAHLSVADRGVTFATTDVGGSCITFHEPVTGFDPAGVVKHPALTITVAEPDLLAAAIDEARSTPAPDEPPVSAIERASYLQTVRSMVDWRRRSVADVHQRERSIEHVKPPPHRCTAEDDAQPFADGVGPGFHRRYRVHVTEPTCSAASAIANFADRLDRAVDDSLAPVTKLDGALDRLSVGDRYVLTLAGPWNAPVEVVHRDDVGFRFATLRGHLEAGVIDFRARDLDGGVEFTIESWARNGDRPMQFVYDRLGIARALQAELWVRTCERFVAVAGGRKEQPVELLTERAR